MSEDLTRDAILQMKQAQEQKAKPEATKPQDTKPKARTNAKAKAKKA